MNSRQKGARGERELVELYRQAGFEDAGRSPHSGADIRWKGDLLGVPGLHIEAKRTEKLRIWDAWEQADSQAGDLMPAVHFRRNRSPWLVAVRLSHFMELLRRAQ